MFFKDTLKCLFLKYRADRIPARPVASIKWVKLVSPRLGPDGGVKFFKEKSEGKKPEKQESVGEAGGEGGHGGGVCVHETEMGLVGSAEEKEMDSTFVCSYTDAPVERA